MSESYEINPSPEHAPVIERHDLVYEAAKDVLGEATLNDNGVMPL